MRNLRRKKRETVIIEEDIEAPIAPKRYDAAASPYAASSASATGSSHRPNNPALLALTVLRKVLYLLKYLYEDVDIATPGGVVTLLQEIAVGFTLGILAMSIFLFLDYKDVMHLQSAHKYRNETFQLMRDPTTRENFEENSGLKFIEADEYQQSFAEINSFPAEMKPLEEKTKKVLEDLGVAKMEHAAIKPGYDILTLDPMLGLDKFCGECIWSGGTNCDARLSYLMSKYGMQTVKGKVELMKSTPQCVRNV